MSPHDWHPTNLPLLPSCFLFTMDIYSLVQHRKRFYSVCEQNIFADVWYTAHNSNRPQPSLCKARTSEKRYRKIEEKSKFLFREKNLTGADENLIKRETSKSTSGRVVVSTCQMTSEEPHGISIHFNNLFSPRFTAYSSLKMLFLDLDTN